MTTDRITTDRQIAALKPQARPYERAVIGARGLLVRVFPSGARSFELRYSTPGGTRRRMLLGEYPALKLAHAVELALGQRVEVIKGRDPAGEREAERWKARTGDSIESLADAYFKAAQKGLHGGRGRPKRASTLMVERNRFDRHIKPELGARKFAEVGRSDVKRFMRELASRGDLAADTVASIGRTLSSIFAFAVFEERLDANPASGLTRPLALKTRERMFDQRALAGIWKVLSAPIGLPTWWPDANTGELKPLKVGPNKATSLALQLAITTLTRRQDCAGARWDEIDLHAKVWTIPAGRHKSGRAHVVPLTGTALATLREADQLRHKPPRPKDFIFPSPAKVTAAITVHALTTAIRRLCIALDLPHGSPHDFRRTGATLLTSERGGIRRFIVSKVLAHAAVEGAAVTEVYDRNEYLPDKRRALEVWEDIFLSIVEKHHPTMGVAQASH